MGRVWIQEALAPVFHWVKFERFVHEVEVVLEGNAHDNKHQQAPAVAIADLAPFAEHFVGNSFIPNLVLIGLSKFFKGFLIFFLNKDAAVHV